MKLRSTPLPEPPDRSPYFRCAVAGGTVVLRVPSLHQLGRVARVLEREHLQPLMAVAVAVQKGGKLLDTLMAARHGAADAPAMLGAAVGIGWADPTLELETPMPADWDASTLLPYGAGVFDELHEAGWSLSAILGGAVAVAAQIRELANLEGEVAERAGFFVPKMVPSSSDDSKSSPTSSADASAPSAAES